MALCTFINDAIPGLRDEVDTISRLHRADGVIEGKLAHAILVHAPLLDVETTATLDTELSERYYPYFNKHRLHCSKIHFGPESLDLQRRRGCGYSSIFFTYERRINANSKGRLGKSRLVRLFRKTRQNCKCCSTVQTDDEEEHAKSYNIFAPISRYNNAEKVQNAQHNGGDGSGYMIILSRRAGKAFRRRL